MDVELVGEYSVGGVVVNGLRFSSSSQYKYNPQYYYPKHHRNHTIQEEELDVFVDCGWFVCLSVCLSLTSTMLLYCVAGLGLIILNSKISKASTRSQSSEWDHVPTLDRVSTNIIINNHVAAFPSTQSLSLFPFFFFFLWGRGGGLRFSLFLVYTIEACSSTLLS